MGLEPTTTGITIQDSTNWATATILKLACPTGIEPVTPSLENWCSIQLSYGQLTYQIKLISGLSLFIIGRGGEIRTPDILLPKQARYQATLHPERANIAYLHIMVNYYWIFIYYTLGSLLMFFISILLKCSFIYFRLKHNDCKNNWWQKYCK